jgi:hypothetical protein
VDVKSDELRVQYETTSHEEVFREARRQCEQALDEAPDDAHVHMNYAYRLECHANNQLRQAVVHYERDEPTVVPTTSSATNERTTVPVTAVTNQVFPIKGTRLS